MERIISYNELPYGKGQSVYLWVETNPNLYNALIQKGYRVITHIKDVDDSTIFISCRHQDYYCFTADEFKQKIDLMVRTLFSEKGITKPLTQPFDYDKLINHEYKLPFVFKNEVANGGKEKFLIATEQDYNHLINAIEYAINPILVRLLGDNSSDLKYRIDYAKYLKNRFVIQEYIQTPSKYNTTVRLLTSSSKDLLYASLKYNEPADYQDDTSILGYLLKNEYPLSNQSIVSNTLSGGKNVLLGEMHYSSLEKSLLSSHNIASQQFEQLVDAAECVHQDCHSELGILCGFDFIYDQNREQWFLLEYHSKPMVKDYSQRQGIVCNTNDDRLIADGRVRSTALALTLRKRN